MLTLIATISHEYMMASNVLKSLYQSILDKVSFSNNSNTRQHSGEYAMHRIEYTDYKWLSSRDIARFNESYDEAITNMNNTFELEIGTINSEGWKDTDSYKGSLFLMYKFLACDLWGAPNNEKITGDYLTTSIHILKELCIRGIYPLYGCEPTLGQRSHFHFTVVIKDDVENDFVKLLKALYQRGVNVRSRKVKNHHIERELLFAHEKDALVYSEDVDISIDKLDIICTAIQQSTCIDINFGMCGMISTEAHCYDVDEYRQKEDSLATFYSMYYVETWSQTFDTFRVEDVLLQLWLQFNSKHGKKNDSSSW